jgi:choline dehydrogenase-like flavoprotein
MKPRRQATLRAAIEVFVPPDVDVAHVARLVTETVETLSPKRLAELELLLDLLAAPMRLPLPARARVLGAMAGSPVGKLRTGFATLKRLALFTAYADGDPDGKNRTWKRIGYPGPRDDRSTADTLPPLATAREGELVEADVVVIGSGAGGGVAASTFARAGRRVVVLEAGAAYGAADFTQRETAIPDLYLERGLASSQDLGLIVLAGAALGGGTTINWSTSFRLPARIAAEWETESGIEGLATELAPHYDALEAELELTPCERHNPNNAVLVEGCRALGLHVGTMPRNAPEDCGEGCGYCGLGCAYDKKRSTLERFLPEVVTRGGAIYAEARVERILLEGGRATGVAVAQRDMSGEERRFTVRAKTVVCAAGSLRTPGLLARSGIAHPLLGQRLFVHPVFAIAALFDEAIDGWNGPIQTAYSDAFNYRAGNYGAKLEVAPVHPAFAAMALPWTSAAAHARTMDDLRYSALLIELTRDRDPGRIDLDEEAAIHYALSPFDAENALAGLVGAVDVAFAAGARKIRTLHAAPLEIASAEWKPSRRGALVAQLRAIGVAANRQPLFSAHQMGTAAMGADPFASVVDARGRVWGYENLLVADASVFPQSSGVNPMLTIMALARRTATLALEPAEALAAS